MKWTEDKVEILKDLVKEGTLYRDIGEKLGCSTKAVREKTRKLGIKSRFRELHSETINCLHCHIEIKAPIFEKRKFCSRSCSVAHNNTKRQYTEEQKRIKRTQLNEIRKVNEKQTFSINRNFRKCKKCDGEFYCKTVKLYCDKCRTSYYSIYRPSCEFDFILDDYKDKIPNYNLIKEYGLYSPSNKGNNLNGISKDHMVSVKYGFENNISPEIIKHPANCMLLKHSDNNIKKTSNSITIEELIKRIEEF